MVLKIYSQTRNFLVLTFFCVIFISPQTRCTMSSNRKPLITTQQEVNDENPFWASSRHQSPKPAVGYCFFDHNTIEGLQLCCVDYYSTSFNPNSLLNLKPAWGWVRYCSRLHPQALGDLPMVYCATVLYRLANSHPFCLRLTQLPHQNWTIWVRNAWDFCPIFTSHIYVIIEPKIAPSPISSNCLTLRLASLVLYETTTTKKNTVQLWWMWITPLDPVYLVRPKSNPLWLCIHYPYRLNPALTEV